MWDRVYLEPGKGVHLANVHRDENGHEFQWRLVDRLQIIRETTDALLVDGMRQRDRLMRDSRSSNQRLIAELNERRRRKMARWEQAHDWST